MECFTDLENLLNQTNLLNKISQKDFTFWKLLQGDRSILEDLEKRILF